ncbi:hypothetical protein NL676_021292 [Syzygium grande]|nr:hypothetical protein NL676_021292 [Syzygium grande]
MHTHFAKRSNEPTHDKPEGKRPTPTSLLPPGLKLLEVERPREKGREQDPPPESPRPCNPRRVGRAGSLGRSTSPKFSNLIIIPKLSKCEFLKLPHTQIWSKVGQQARTHSSRNIKDAQDSLRRLLSTSFGSPLSSPSKWGPWCNEACEAAQQISRVC